MPHHFDYMSQEHSTLETLQCLKLLILPYRMHDLHLLNGFSMLNKVYMKYPWERYLEVNVQRAVLDSLFEYKLYLCLSLVLKSRDCSKVLSSTISSTKRRKTRTYIDLTHPTPNSAFRHLSSTCLILTLIHFHWSPAS